MRRSESLWPGRPRLGNPLGGLSDRGDLQGSSRGLPPRHTKAVALADASLPALQNAVSILTFGLRKMLAKDHEIVAMDHFLAAFAA